MLVIKRLFLFFVFSATFCGQNGFARPLTENVYIPVPAEAQSYVDGLPEKAITLEVLIGRAMATTSTYRSIQSGRLSEDASLLQSKAPLTTRLEVEGIYNDDRNEPTSAFSTVSNTSNTYRLGLSKAFTTGTSLSAEIIHDDSEIEFTNFPTSKFKQTQAILTLSQNLWKDRFGRGIKSQVEAGRLNSAATKLQINELSIDWMFALIQTFYSAWQGQEQVREAKAGVDRKKRLLKITKIQKARGTAEEPDVLQVQRSLLAAEVQYVDAVQVVEELWRRLVFVLDFPIEWLRIDPLKVPLLIKDPVSEAVALCARPVDEFSGRSEKVEVLLLQKKAMEKNLVSAKDALAPDLKVNFSFNSNGVDENDRGETFGDAFSGENPNWTVGFSLKMPLEANGEKAALKRAATEAIRSDADHETAVGDFKIDWFNHCGNLNNWIRKRESLKNSLQQQKKRVRLEEERFRLGRTGLLTVIQAGDEATETAMQWHRSRVQARLAAWQVKRMAGEAKGFMNELEEKLKKMAKKKGGDLAQTH